MIIVGTDEIVGRFVRDGHLVAIPAREPAAWRRVAPLSTTGCSPAGTAVTGGSGGWIDVSDH